MQLATPASGAGRCRLSAVPRVRTGREITGNRDEDVSALVGVAPCNELRDSCLHHLIGMETRIFVADVHSAIFGSRWGILAYLIGAAWQSYRNSDAGCLGDLQVSGLAVRYAPIHCLIAYREVTLLIARTSSHLVGRHAGPNPGDLFNASLLILGNNDFIAPRADLVGRSTHELTHIDD